MKERTYLGPILVGSVGTIVSIILFVLLIANAVNSNGGYYKIDNNNNIIEFKAGIDKAVISTENSEVNPVVASKINGNEFKLERYSDDVAIEEYRIIFDVLDGDMSFEIQDPGVAGFFTEGEQTIGTLFATGEGTVGVSIETVLGETESAPDIYISEIGVADKFVSQFMVFCAVLILTILATTLYFILVYNSKKKKPIKKNLNTGIPLDYREELMNVDLQFCAESKVDKTKAWLKFTTPGTVLTSEKEYPFIKGIEQIEDSITQLYNLENLDFKWKPTMAFVSHDATLGVTVGLYKRLYIKKGEQINQKGKYVSVWQYYNGEWKIIFNMNK